MTRFLRDVVLVALMEIAIIFSSKLPISYIDLASSTFSIWSLVVRVVLYMCKDFFIRGSILLYLQY